MTNVEQFHKVENPITSTIEKLGDNRPTKSELLQYRPEYYTHPTDDIHGLLHAMNTIIVADAIFTLKMEQSLQITGDIGIYTSENRHILRQAAKYHDSHHSGNDPDFTHGEFAADWIMKNSEDPSREIISELVRAHVPHDEEGMPELLKILKDADSLERVRAPKDSNWYLDLSYIRFKDITLDLIDPLIEVNELENRLLREGFQGDGVDLAIAAFSLLGWVSYK